MKDPFSILTIFATMKTKLPTQSLLKVSCCFSLAISVFLFSSAFMEGETIEGAICRSVMFFFLMMFISIGNTCLLVILKETNRIGVRDCTVGFYISSFIMSTLVMWIMYAFQSYLIQQGISARTLGIKVKGDIIYLYTAVQGLFVNSVLLLLQNFIIVQDANNKAQLENSRLNAASSEAAYQLLQQQIHPHFLFNALNILKSLIKKSPVSAEDYLLRLSDFLRVSVSENKRGLATLKDEVKLGIDYLEMQKVRFGEALQFSFDTEKSEGFLPVFSLQPLLENAIKHNELTDADPLIIEIKQIGNWISVINNIKLRSVAEYSTGSGLANLAERYKLLSGDEIEIRDNGQAFSVSLKILENEDRNYRR
ncbi:sensor histidine kinase YesM [Pedobacter cryoconitis]|uniref:sensor histidine kinase n=1 Tax=Pedobacter cryoconitis TaxID=188932 RepID=UPI00160960F0|nr:histidine kinase [Pedobacter cryoconitis]MBB6269608.1 sensor histidine kinase YesM [Pedobacter cryoconitis]